MYRVQVEADDQRPTASLCFERSHTTPIRQLKAFSGYLNRPSLLAIRTFGETVLAQHLSNAEGDKLSDIRRFTRADLGGHVSMDVDLDATCSSCTIINDRGSVFDFNVGEGRNIPKSVLLCTDDRSPISRKPFWRICRTRTGCLRVSSSSMEQMDFRASSACTSNGTDAVFELQDPKDVIVAVNAFPIPDEHACRIVTNKDVIHLDNRFFTRPVTIYPHGRGDYHHLRLDWVQAGNDTLGCLHSRRNGLVSIYDIHTDGKSRLADIPIAFPHNPGSMNEEHLGTVFFPSRSPNSESFVMCQVQLDGAMHCQLFSTANPPLVTRVESFVKTSAMFQQQDDREFFIADMSFILKDDYLPSLHLPAQQIMSLGEVTDTDMDASPFGPHTGLEAMFERCQMFPAPRSQFLGWTRFKRASSDLLNAEASRHSPSSSSSYNLNNTLRALDPTYPSEETLQQQRQSGSTTELDERLVDLALSEDILSSQPMPGVASSEETPESILEGLSLGTPPPIRYSYFKPKDTVDSMDEDEDQIGVGVLGARLLLQDWVTGSNPQNFVYEDPYDTSPKDSSTTTAASPPPKFSSGLATRTVPAIRSVAFSQVVPPSVQWSHSQPTIAHSQPEAARTVQTQSSQPEPREVFSSTQVLPGPFGGRKSVPLPKKAKKRLGGF
ncbi:hypothetical protein BDV98DRAFT_587980 [Pterulicium gracile]|uniref:RRN6 K-rich C-terminal domain-containing protein n=1 Tax=Pterulicium gracile TaxID=1884261 RepID=A0A5C3R3C9_9AGAR|nr:hypothetical protein BDV98DRAFT_587980 [Pterula gracilis]